MLALVCYNIADNTTRNEIGHEQVFGKRVIRTIHIYQVAVLILTKLFYKPCLTNLTGTFQY